MPDATLLASEVWSATVPRRGFLRWRADLMSETTFDTAARWFREDEMGERPMSETKMEERPTSEELWEYSPNLTGHHYIVETGERQGCVVLSCGKTYKRAHIERIVACVNALAGVDDPAAELARLRRVEQAARAYVDADPDVSDTLALYDALEQAVGR